MMITAIKKDQAFVDELDEKLQDIRNFYLWWLGQSGYLLQWNGKRILIDPYLSDSLTRKYENTDKPHIRMSERVVDPEMLRNIQVVTSSHNHTDHLDADTLRPILRNNPGIQFIVPEANRLFAAERTGCTVDFPIGMNDGEEKEVSGFRFIGVPAKHNEVERDENGHCRFMGYIISFGKWALYHSGDTLWFPELEKILQSFQLHLALLPINGNDPKRKVAGNMNPTEAVQLAKKAHIRRVIPCHYDMFTFNTADPAVFAREAESEGVSYTVLKPGGYYCGLL